MKNRVLKQFAIFTLAFSLLFGSISPAGAIFDKTRFVGDLGIAYYCFHHWVSGPARTGAFSNGAPHRTKALIKAGAALLFALNRVKKADKIAHTSKSPLLHKMATALDSMEASLGTIGSRFKGGKMAPGDLSSLNSAFTGVNGAALANGMTVKDVPVSVP